MTTPAKICGVILAAGASSRMGRDKALLPWPPETRGPETLLSAAVAALQPVTGAVLVVAGRNVEQLTPVAERCGALVVINPAPERGQFSSLQTGLRAALDHGCEAAMITPVDCPPLSADSLAKLRAAFAAARSRGAWAVAPENGGRSGHPLLASHELIQALLAAPVTSNAREVKHAHPEKFEYVAVPDPLLRVEVNTPEEYAALAPKSK
ncbi:MAG: NTP transferase domain-containing protein [Acidobacteriota bacterium]